MRQLEQQRGREWYRWTSEWPYLLGDAVVIVLAVVDIVSVAV
jgi:hypothetical protein